MNDRRHELQTNELAVHLQKINRSIEPYSKQIAVVVGLLVVGGIAWGLYSSKVSGDRSDATLQLIQAVGSSSAEQLATVSDNYPDTAAAAWSRLYEGNAHLANGLQALYADRDEAEALLGDARAAYESALAGTEDRLLQSRGNFGLARVAESLNEIEKAIAAYQKCIDANESEAMVEQAQDRIDALSTPQTKEFLAWFSEQDFKPADPSLPPSLPAEKTLPDLPDFDLPTLGEKLGVGDSGNSDGEGKLEDKAGMELPTDAEMPADAEITEQESSEQAAEPSESPGDADADASDSTKPDSTKPELTEPESTEPESTEPESKAGGEDAAAAGKDNTETAETSDAKTE
jgi:tetratricopeptide (TPR) repeat protein